MGNLTGFIEATTGIKSYEGQLNIGFMIGQTWYNCYGTQAELDEISRHILQKGNQIAFDFQDGQVTNLTLIEARTPKPQSDKSSSEVVNIHGKDHITYKGLLNLAHEKGLQSIEVLNYWVSEDMTRAWCISRVKFKDTYFDGFGSSTPENTGDMVKSHPIEMSQTRSSARALRNALNIGEVAMEEMKNGGSK